MAAKVFLTVGLGVGIALLIQARHDSRSEARILQQETRQWADRAALLFVGAVEHSMLRGDGIKVKASIRDLEQRVDGVDVRIFDHRGIEVFAPKSPIPDPAELQPDVAAILRQPTSRIENDRRVFRPVVNEKRCHECHSSANKLRGVLELVFSPETYVTHRETTLPSIVTAGFTQVMSARQSDLLDDYFAELKRAAPSIEMVAVFDADGDLVFGESLAALQPAMLELSLQPGAQPSWVHTEYGILAMVPLPMQQRCVACHDNVIGSVRGVLVMSLDHTQLDIEAAKMELEGTIDTSLRFIMLSELGRRIADFLDAAASTKTVDSLALYDNHGRRYWTTDHPAPSEYVARVLASGEPAHHWHGNGLDERLETIAPLRNEDGCVRCHGSDSSLRGAVSVSVSTAVATKASRASLRRRTWFTGLTLLGILFMLAGLLQYLVARPVRQIGDVADEVSSGNLSATVERADPDGDEISRLGQRINEMVRGLRTKMHLEKFVSKGAAEAAAGAGVRSISRTGERIAATVLFSDIRGFTSYSERIPPESVVEMLNRLLRAQAEVVVEFGGDIDKYIGDELMAVFIGEEPQARAVACAVRMLEAVKSARRDGETLGIGIGISTGDVVYGAIGHENRMDFTVIGDVVNTGARLCSAAAEDEVFVTAAVREAIDDLPDVRFEPGEPLAVKGKRDLLKVFTATRCARQK